MSLRAKATLLLSILFATPSQSLLLEDDLLVYQEGLEAEASFPTAPEVNQIGSSGFSVFSVPFGVLPAIGGGAVSFELSPISGGGDYYQQVSVLPGDLALAPVGLRSNWSNLELAPDSVPVIIGTTAGGATATTAFSAFALLELDWTTPGVRPIATFKVGDSVAFPDFTNDQSIVSGILSDFNVDRLLAGAALTIDLEVDHTQLTITGSVAVDGATVLTLGPKPFMYVGADPFQQFRAVFSSATQPASTVSVDQRAALTDFEIFMPFSEAYVVDSTDDEVDLVPGDGQCETASTTCTLRAAVQESNANAGPSRITFSSIFPLPFALSRSGEDEDAADTGDLDVLDDLAIRGRGIDDTIIDGLGLDRVFHVPQSATDTIFEISDLTVQHGSAFTTTSRAGGGIDSWGATTIRRCAIHDNEAGYGGGLFNRRHLRLLDSRVTDNQALPLAGPGGRGGGIGGGVFASETTLDPTIAILRSSIVGNSAQQAIGGAEFVGTDSVLIEDSTFSANTSGGFERALQLTNSNAILRHVTLVGSTPLGVGSTGSPASIEIANTVVQGDVAACSLTTNSAVTYLYSGNNASNDTSCGFTGASDIEGQNLGLGLLEQPGDTHAHRPDAASPLRDAADPALCFGSTDQIGTLRPLDSDSDGTAICELGAIEVPEPGFATLLAAGGTWLGIVGRRRSVRRSIAERQAT